LNQKDKKYNKNNLL